MGLVVLENVPVISETIIVNIQNYTGMKDTFLPVNDGS